MLPAHQPPGIENDPDRLATLGLVEAGDELAAPGRGCPADIAQVVAGEVFAQAFEVAAQASLTHLPELQIDLAASGQEDLLVFALAQRGINTHRLLRAAPRPSAPQVREASVANKQRSGARISALARFNAIANRGAQAGKSAERMMWPASPPRPREGRPPAGTRAGPCPGCSTASSISVSLSSAGALLHERSTVIRLRSRQAQSIPKRGGNHQCVPSQHAVAEARIEKARERKQQARRQQADRARRQAKRETAARLTNSPHRLGMEAKDTIIPLAPRPRQAHRSRPDRRRSPRVRPRA